MTLNGPSKFHAIPTTLIAPCGMNCRLCVAFTRAQNPCPGCRADDGAKPKTRVRCFIKTCAIRKRRAARFCLGCDRFPCGKLKHLDQRYRTRYGMSMIENLATIGAIGVRRFAAEEAKRWRCTGCGELLCVHKPRCLSCGRARP